jgi:general secretion pathway protein J
MRRVHRPREAGFTLLELMISLTLLGIMMVMTYSVFATALAAVPRGEDAAERSGRLRMATSLITRQVRSLMDYPAETEDEVHPYFEGNPQTFKFITAAPQLGGGEGLSWVTYFTDGRTLWMAERVIFSMGALTAEEPEAVAQTALLEGLKGVRFQYLRLDGTDSEWIDEWSGLEEQSPPAAIRITLDGIGIGDSYWVQEIPVMTVVYALGSYDSDVGVEDDEEGGFGFGADNEEEDEFDPEDPDEVF